MFYLIDGYNLIFTAIESRESLQTLRQKVIRTLQKHFARKKISGILVFDGAHRREEESGLSYPSPLIVAYTPKGQSADEYMVEYLHTCKSPKQVIIITNDRGLARHVKAAGAHVQSNEAFLAWLNKQKKKTKSIAPRDTEQNMDRLLKIFEERLRDHGDG